MVGIGIGWWVKGSGSGDAGSASSAGSPHVEGLSPAGSESGSASAASAAHPPAKSHDRPPKEAQKDLPKLALDAATKYLLDSMQEQQAKRNEGRIAKLVEKLGLDASQEVKLRDFFKQQSEATAIKVGEDGKSVQMTQRNNGASLDDFLEDLLSDTQEQDYEKMKQAEGEQRIEARTLREMASLTQAVELRPEQRDAVYAILQEQARHEESAPGPKMFNAGMITPPMELAGAGSPVDTVMSIRTAGPEGSAPDENAIEQARQQRQAQIDEKVNRMSGVLDEKQLEQYRASLGKGTMVLPR